MSEREYISEMIGEKYYLWIENILNINTIKIV